VSETPIHNLLTVKETAEYLRIPLPTVYYLVQRGQIPAIHIGGRWRIKKSSLDRDILRQDKQGQPTVLVVDDDPDLQELFKAFLKKIGFSRVVVGTAKDAIHSLRKQKFDLMFLDLQLPDAPGDEVYKTAKQIDPDLNVIVITGYPDSEMMDRILQISPVTVLKKPLLSGHSDCYSPPVLAGPATLGEAEYDLARSSRSVTSASLVWRKS
jgi:excisionase family DNA binding protein